VCDSGAAVFHTLYSSLIVVGILMNNTVVNR